MIPLLIIATIFIVGRLIDLDRYLSVVQQWVWRMGPWGNIFFIFIYIGATLFLLPGTPFTILAAFLFGTLRGYIIMVVASNLAALTINSLGTPVIASTLDGGYFEATSISN